MLFASTNLVARIEEAECGLLADSIDVVLRRDPGTGPFVIPLAGGIATFSAPGSPLNKVAGLGFAGPLDEGALAAVEEAFAERGSPVQVEIATLADPSIGQKLTARGYVLQGFENVLGRSLPVEHEAPRAPSVEILPSPLSELSAWIDVVVTGFASPDAQGVPSHESFPRELIEGIMRDMASTGGFSRYLARRDGVIAGGASMRLAKGVAQLCGAATLPEHRRRGVQSALLSARLEIATKAGCDVAVVTTQPGSKSQENVQRQGFELLYTRAVLVRSPS
ncbi:GNAT family N-acetyltransferase [Polyangium jinanense]|uniref:GNAT family N-acetyltransferase n=1 Tax=Polyangium jinanense TaxID=2829994 RepID=A0A9X3XGG4_9BACT|nr:GNAT family N-acetyltransferase [Polyangium jinanense]MDC3962475.1 GNAT family N-acetyltransferase [Polyangium jinanense]MDC3989244.1 GNAT family N-acetyltransferase [Polyangium jinanense]MDC3989577.1 GNAT family N-acetyltransferase [Polyangium jinanense]